LEVARELGNTDHGEVVWKGMISLRIKVELAQTGIGKKVGSDALRRSGEEVKGGGGTRDTFLVRMRQGLMEGIGMTGIEKEGMQGRGIHWSGRAGDRGAKTKRGMVKRIEENGSEAGAHRDGETANESTTIDDDTEMSGTRRGGGKTKMRCIICIDDVSVVCDWECHDLFLAACASSYTLLFRPALFRAICEVELVNSDLPIYSPEMEDIIFRNDIGEVRGFHRTYLYGKELNASDQYSVILGVWSVRLSSH
jgi:hypothetical protein